MQSTGRVGTWFKHMPTQAYTLTINLYEELIAYSCLLQLSNATFGILDTRNKRGEKQ